jgi:hypothetical protein
VAVSSGSDELMLQPIQNAYSCPILTLKNSNIFLELDRKVNGILLKIFNFLDFGAYLPACQVNRHLYKVLTDVHREVKEDIILFNNQVDRLFSVKKLNSCDYVILESTFVRVDTIKMNVFIFDPNRNPSANVVLLCQNNEEIILDLSDQCKKVIFEVSTGNNRPDNYNCVDFVMDSIGRYDEKKFNELSLIKREKLIEATLFPGDIIALCDDEDEYLHFALYAENGIYLSKLGVEYEGVLPFTLKSMMKGYGAKYAYKMKTYV